MPGISIKELNFGKENYSVTYSVDDKNNVKSLSIIIKSKINYHKQYITQSEYRRLNTIFYKIIENTLSSINFKVIDINNNFNIVDISDNFLDSCIGRISLTSHLYLSNNNLTFKTDKDKIINDISNLVEGVINKLEDLSTVTFTKSRDLNTKLSTSRRL